MRPRRPSSTRSPAPDGRPTDLHERPDRGLHRGLRMGRETYRGLRRPLMARKSAKVAVIGAGIGGAAAALSLAQIGVEVDVFDAVMTIRPFGVGINLLPHAVREL